MTVDNRIEQLLDASSDHVRGSLWDACFLEFSPHDFAKKLQNTYARTMQSDSQKALRIVALIHELGEISAEQDITALALRSEGNVRSVALGQHAQALTLFDQAGEIHQRQNAPIEKARLQIGRIWALSNLDRYAEAVAAGEDAVPILKSAELWSSYALLVNNLAMIHNRFGKPHKSLPLLQSARKQLRQAGQNLRHRLVGTVNNQIYVLCMLGRFDEALTVGQEALQVANEVNYPVLIGLVKQNLALTYHQSGRFNQALQLHDEAIRIWESTGWTQGRVQVELNAAVCLLQLRRFWDVIQRFEAIHTLCQTHQVLPDTPHDLLIEAKAYAGLHRYDEALTTVDRIAQLIGTASENEFSLAVVNLARAELLLKQFKWTRAIEAAVQAMSFFEAGAYPLGAAEGFVLLAHARFAMNELEQAQADVQQGLQLAESHQLLSVIFSGETLLGRMADRPLDALAHLTRAFDAVRRLEAGMMLEFRPTFLQDGDKQTIYESLVRINLQLNRNAAALAYVEEAKSRSLLAMVSKRVTLRLEARHVDDEPIVVEMNELTAQHNALYRQIQQSGGSQGINQEKLLQDQQTIEARLTELRTTLLIRNADYVRDLSLTEIHVANVQPYLDEDTLLLEYYVIEGELILFCVSAETISTHTCATPFRTIQRTQYALNVNFKTIPRLPISKIPKMVGHAQKVLRTLYQQLIAPIRDQLSSFERLIIVPHDSLHYLPFHALFDGTHYLVETHTLSYLPASTFLAYTKPIPATVTGMLAVGYSHGDLLPEAVSEAQSIASEWPSQLLLEGDAQRAAVMASAQQQRMLHFATHGEFRADNPLFSGLALQDGWLTTLDIFNMQLQASLVTLSGCNTGRSMLGGGDELLGLTRAFLAAGAHSLVLSHWAVEDVVSAELMRVFYQALKAGATKGDALRQAQQHLLTEDQLPDYVRHPYFWAPFYLVGSADAL
ncbi:MAG: CHAT domain-containing protein [Candidatus Promineifilaceae bacterium]